MDKQDLILFNESEQLSAISYDQKSPADASSQFINVKSVDFLLNNSFPDNWNVKLPLGLNLNNQDDFFNNPCNFEARESMGILTIKDMKDGLFNKAGHFDERDSLSFVKMNNVEKEFFNVSDVRESFGILKMRDMKDGLCNIHDHFDIRESLGILKINDLQDDLCNLDDRKVFSPKSVHSTFTSNIEKPTKLEQLKIYSLSSPKSPRNGLLKSTLIRGALKAGLLSEHGLCKCNLDCLDKSLENSVKNLDTSQEIEMKDFINIEARHVAEKIADGSILDDCDACLSSTLPPEFAEVEVTPDKPKNMVDVFKCVDKMLPPTKANINMNQEEIAVEQTHSISLGSVLELAHNSNICQLICKKILNSNIEIKDPKEIFQRLLHLISVANKTAEQMAEGHNLILKLFHLLHDNSLNISQDSGFLHGTFEGFELKHNKEQPNSDANLEPMDLSTVKSTPFKQESSEIVDSKRNSVAPPAAPLKNILGKDIQPAINRPLKLKSKLVDDMLTANKKGPLKATVPVNSYVNESETGDFKTSTPYKINSQPIAQSTPESTHRSRHSMESKATRGSQVEKLNRRGTTGFSNKILTNLTNNRGKSLSRSGSSNDLKEQNKGNKTNLKKSNSIGQDLNIEPTTTAAIGGPALKKTLSLQKLTFPRNYNRTGKIRVASRAGMSENPVLRPSTMSKVNKGGKENVQPTKSS